jgi:site-specific DNA recombinase
VRAILGNELYRGRVVWNRSSWQRVSGTSRRRRVPRPRAEWTVVERPDLGILDEALWNNVQARRARLRGKYEHTREFGKTRTEYGTHPLSGLLICGVCGGRLTIRTGSISRGDQRYGCSRRWRGGPAACTNGLHVRRDLVEKKIFGLVNDALYNPEAVARLVEKVNDRLRAVQAAGDDRSRLLARLGEVRQQLERLRQFVLGGDTSAKVREWLAETEGEEGRLTKALDAAEEVAGRKPLAVHPGLVRRYLDDLAGLLKRSGPRTRLVLQGDIDRIVVHPVPQPGKTKPFARAEVVTSGKGLLERVAFVVAGARFELWKRPLKFEFLLSY